MPNVNVYVSQPLADRLEQYKERIKVSEICQTALATAIAAEEEADRGNRVPRIISRLQRTLSPREATKAAAYDMGRDWAERTASITELRSVARLRDVARNMFTPASSLRTFNTGGVAVTWTREGQDDETGYLPDTVPQAWFIEAAKGGGYFDASVWGFIEGAADLWDIVRTELEKSTGDVDPDDIPF